MRWLLHLWRWFLGLWRRPEKVSVRYQTLAEDGIPWQVWPIPARIIAVGDIHGELAHLGAILRECELIDAQGTWRGGTTHLVLLGDLVGGSADSRLLVNFVLRLETEAKAQGGAVHALLGNHDLIPAQGDVGKMTRSERALYEYPVVNGAPGTKAKHAFRGHSVYAQWLRQRNSLLKIGDTLFVHAGLDKWALETEPGRINATIRAWIRYWQGVDEKPGKRTRWAVGKPGMERGSRWETGPLWNRAFKAKAKRRPRSGPKRKTLRKILERFAVKRMVIGHAPVPSSEILLSHPYYESMVVSIDTRIGDGKHGSLSALEIRAGHLRPIYAPSPDGGEVLLEIERKKLLG